MSTSDDGESPKQTVRGSLELAAMDQIMVQTQAVLNKELCDLAYRIEEDGWASTFDSWVTDTTSFLREHEHGEQLTVVRLGVALWMILDQRKKTFELQDTVIRFDDAYKKPRLTS